MKFEEAVEKYLTESVKELDDKESNTLANIMTGKTGLDSSAPMPEYYNAVKKAIKSLSKASDKELKSIMDAEYKKYPKKYKIKD